MYKRQPYSGWLDYDGARFYFQNGAAVTGWQYIDGLKFYFGPQGVLVQDLDPVLGIQPSYQLRVNKALNCLTVYAKDGDNGYIIPVKAMLTSVGDDTPLGTFYTPEKYRWRLMVNDTYTQYATRLTAGQGFLFHSITYASPVSYTHLDVYKRQEEEHEILESGAELACDVLKLGHHGSSNASSYRFLRETCLLYTSRCV